MAMFDAPAIPTRTPLERPERPQLEVGDRVRVRQMLTTDVPVLARDGAHGTVVRISGNRVVVELDEPYVATGIRQRLFFSFAEELERARVVGRMGAVELFDEDGDSEDDEG